MKAKRLTDKELETLADKLALLEHELLTSRGLSKISGGFVHIDMFDYDDDYIDVEIKSGVQSDAENNVSIEQVKLDRNTFEMVD